jgi:hypothetical protein
VTMTNDRVSVSRTSWLAASWASRPADQWTSRLAWAWSRFASGAPRPARAATLLGHSRDRLVWASHSRLLLARVSRSRLSLASLARVRRPAESRMQVYLPNIADSEVLNEVSQIVLETRPAESRMASLEVRASSLVPVDLDSQAICETSFTSISYPSCKDRRRPVDLHRPAARPSPILVAATLAASTRPSQARNRVH